MKLAHSIIAAALVLSLAAKAGAAYPKMQRPSEPTDGLQVFSEPNGAYVLHTDVSKDEAREAYIRMNKMAAEYNARLQGISSKPLRAQLPFFFFRHKADYDDASNLPGSAGVYKRDEKGARLMAYAGEKMSDSTWHVVQHEGFHQFFDALVGGDLPPWLNEGMAEYFGEALYTGDGFVSAVIPPGRLERIKSEINDEKFVPLRKMRQISSHEWNSGLKIENYDQAWSMVHFLAHGQGGKYQKPLISLFNILHRGVGYNQAWTQIFGSDDDAFEKQWKSYWLGQPENPSADLFSQATTATLTSFLARAFEKKQKFDNFEEFLKAAEKNEIQFPKLSDPDWLPPALLAEAVGQVADRGRFTLERATPNAKPTIVCVTPAGTKYVGSFTLGSGGVEKVSVETPKKAVAPKAQVPPVVAPPATKPAKPASD